MKQAPKELTFVLEATVSDHCMQQQLCALLYATTAQLQQATCELMGDDK